MPPGMSAGLTDEQSAGANGAWLRGYSSNKMSTGRLMLSSSEINVSVR